MMRKFFTGLLIAMGIAATAGAAVASADDHSGMTHNSPQAAQCRCMTHDTPGMTHD